MTNFAYPFMSTQKSFKLNKAIHPIFLGKSVFKKLSAFVKKGNYSSLHILVDENSMQHCLPILIANCAELKEANIIEIESGEENKSIEICVELWATLTDEKAERKALLLNLGGGVICDMGGFVASTFKRGIDFVNIPTTLLAQVDASVGGKLAINLEGYKNQIGLFASPKAVFIETTFLQTLSNREYLSGFAEMIKHALVADSNYWNKLKKVDVTQNNFAASFVSRSIEIKSGIVLADPYEKGLRKVLKFGHTIGHALESYFLKHNKNYLLHGEAVAIGIICEAYLSSIKLGFDKRQLKDLCDFITLYYKKYNISSAAYPAIIALMLQDKKNEKKEINFTLLKKTGKAIPNHNFTTAQIKEALDFYNNL